MRANWRDFLLFSGIAVSVPLIVILLIRLTPKPPAEEVEYAREALSQAGKDRADTYSKKLYNEAKAFYDSAMVNWQRQNTRFIYFRDYDRVLMFARQSIEKAEKAGENSISSTSSLKIRVKQKIDILNELVSEINELFTTYPLTAETRNRISQGKMLLKEAEIIYRKGQYLQANRKITDSEYLLTNSYENATTNLKDYFKSYPTWKNWVTRTINDSKKNRDYSIIIDKFSRKCYIYQNGVKKLEFTAELGKNWVGDKRVKGDKATPEGMYKVTKKIDGRSTKYYKALLIDYPNDEDKENFRKEIARGSLPASAKIGNLIEIHGNGGKGIDWTDGCIALTDKEMDSVFRIAKVGTPVTIVGSMIELEDIVNR
ncbi:MAG: L,D-transpeptidase family protein [Bacteroidales bacterium]|nr:L,D-transpeptidase family protein [Bacteroidales bacterium]